MTQICDDSFRAKTGAEYMRLQVLARKSSRRFPRR